MGLCCLAKCHLLLKVNGKTFHESMGMVMRCLATRHLLVTSQWQDFSQLNGVWY